MEILYIALAFLVGAVLAYFIGKSQSVSRKVHEELNANFIKSQSDFDNSCKKNDELSQLIDNERKTNREQTEILSQLKDDFARISAEHSSLNSQLSEQKNLNTKQSEEIASLQKSGQDYHAKNSELEAINKNLERSLAEQKEELKKIHEAAKNEFKNLANEILEEKTKRFTESNKQNLDTLLKPLGENIENFKKQVDEVYKNESRERFSLNNTIKLMMEQTNKVSQEANNLAAALKGQTKTQGDWGEMILERILEDSGLTKGREYFAQHTITNEDGETQRPDFILKLPGEQIVVIDSKVSLNAYDRMCSAENEEQRLQNLALHTAAVKRHIDTLATKRYDNMKQSLDFTIMFIPIEPAFLSAVQHDTNLWNYAYQKHIIMLSPTNLIAYLKLISDVWKRSDQKDNAEEIARVAGAMYDKFEGFVQDLLKIGRKLDETKTDYETAMKKLSTGRGNLVTSAQRVKSLGASAKKNLPEAIVERATLELPENGDNLFPEKSGEE
ncbi:DNA recombination protein RmuC [Cruoricaptor ignavus]|uniref:DNA recombination protein RmuC n=1 Tax=Cruoricaptor ignavus TaxID=1118202 RepID=A0A7M1SZK4_9FLAO|nr:DNA recombination protein RmuC [Cruoricaptor ignavus]QOR73016.1 DNA recombination protein RmuC [Cruoricaptor ignavus]